MFEFRKGIGGNGNGKMMAIYITSSYIIYYLYIYYQQKRKEEVERGALEPQTFGCPGEFGDTDLYLS